MMEGRVIERLVRWSEIQTPPLHFEEGAGGEVIERLSSNRFRQRGGFRKITESAQEGT